MRKFASTILLFFRDLFRFRKFLFEMIQKDFKAKFVGSYLGIIWAFFQPLMTILIMWFVFQVGFRSQPVESVPFILWLLAGIIPWFFFTDALSSATNSIVEYGFLIKKIVFKVSAIPIIKLGAALFIHLFFIVFIFIAFAVYRIYPDWYNLQVLYYLFCTIVFILGASYITSTLTVFVKDVSQVIALLLQFGFWLTPIFWSFKMVPPRFIAILKLNPAYYLIEGYRDSFIHHIWFWEKPVLSLYFWGITLVIWLIGGLLFKKLKPHFADIL